MSSKIAGDNEEPIADINIVPFVDIILVVLIIFMVTTPFIMKPSININLPKAGSGDDTTPSELSISIAADGHVVLNGKASDEAAISAYAKDLALKKPDVQAIISADKDVTHGRVVGIIDAVKTAGVKKFAITIDKNRSLVPGPASTGWVWAWSTAPAGEYAEFGKLSLNSNLLDMKSK